MERTHSGTKAIVCAAIAITFAILVAACGDASTSLSNGDRRTPKSGLAADDNDGDDDNDNESSIAYALPRS